MTNTALGVVRGLKLPSPDVTMVEYSGMLLKLSEKLKSLTIENLIRNKKFTRSYDRSVRNDDVVDDLELALKAIKAGIARQLLASIKLLPELFNEVRAFTARSVKRSIVYIENSVSNVVPVLNGSATFRLPKAAILRKNWALENARLIKSLPTEMLSKVSQAVSQAVATGESVDSLKKRITQITDITGRRAKIIARDQISKLRGALVRHESLSRGIVHYEWSTSGDEAVRTSHKVMNGKICSWLNADTYKNSLNDNKWKKRASIGGVQQHPGEDIMCRCTSFVAVNVEGKREVV